MRYKLLGRSGLRVSELALGTMTFGEAWGWGSSKDESRRVFDAFVDAGGNFIDTADLYVDGTSENYLGEFMRGKREQLVLLSKFNSRTPPVSDPNATGNHRKHLVQALEASLRRLGTDYLDVYVVHVPDFLTPPDELMRALDDLIRAGKVLYLGVSDFPAWRVAQANTLADAKGWSPFIMTTLQYSLIERTPERELLPMALALDIGVTSWSPVAAGLLAGKYNGPEHGSRRPAAHGELRRLDASPQIPPTERNLAVAAAVRDVAGDAGCTPAQLALAWVRRRGVIPVVGARTAEQLREDLGCLDVNLAPEQLRRLDDATRIELGFPHDFLAQPEVREGIYGGMLGQIDTHRPHELPADLLRAQTT